MAVSLGKRKRQAVISQPSREVGDDRDDVHGEDEAARALFQRAFEAKFQALDRPPAKPAVPGQDEGEEEIAGGSTESDWSGLSDDDQKAIVEIVDHGRVETSDADRIALEKIHKKTFMSSRPTQSEHTLGKPLKAVTAAKEDDDSIETANLKNDLALQRLLKESHLLDPFSSQRSSFNVEGKGRLKALDMRLQDLGAKSSALQQEKMPIAQRKGIVAKQIQRETSRRKEAADNGIILEKAKAAAKVQKRRERSIGGPAIGKFQHGTLKLSSRDVKDIVGSSSGSGRGRKGRK